jgi:hypothetical protein
MLLFAFLSVLILLLRLFNSNIKSVLNGSGTWRETASSIRPLQGFLNRCLRTILGVRWPDIISNKELWRKINNIDH